MAITHRLKNSHVEAVLLEDPPQEPLPAGVIADEVPVPDCKSIEEREYFLETPDGHVPVYPGQSYILLNELSEYQTCSTSEFAEFYEEIA